MTYWNFLFLFVILPILGLGCLALIDRTKLKNLPVNLQARPFWLAVILHMFIALAYTTFWDNYLVATGVWTYDPKLVSGIVFGWVPIEEYTFFLLQPLLAGLFLLFILKRFATSEPLKSNSHRWRIYPALVLGTIWLVAFFLFLFQWKPGTYLSLELIWALPPIALQIIFGGDILRSYPKPIFLGILFSTLYLSAADTLAIHSGTWSINSHKSLHLLIGGVLPVEEFIFFMLTNILVIFGTVLFIEVRSWERIENAKLKFRQMGEINKIL